jgi:hypothetical protein
LDFKRPERCRWQRTGREDRRSKFYEVPDNLVELVALLNDAPNLESVQADETVNVILHPLFLLTPRS